jgi:hypothetical protein
MASIQLSPTVTCDEKILDHILDFLVKNHIQACPKCGRSHEPWCKL